MIITDWICSKTIKIYTKTNNSSIYQFSYRTRKTVKIHNQQQYITTNLFLINNSFAYKHFFFFFVFVFVLTE